MQPSTETTTLFTHSRHTDASGYLHNRRRHHESTPTCVNARSNTSHLVAKPAQLDGDFHLDTFFNPVWMSGPHVFSFTKDGTVVRPETYLTEPRPGYRAGASSSLGHGAHGVGVGVAAGAGTVPPGPSSHSHLASRSFPFSRTIPSKYSAGMDKHKPWKNVAITEQDDAEFAAMEAEAEMRARAEAKGGLVELVYTWPPKPLSACAECAVLERPRRRETDWTGTRTWASTSAGTPGSAMPALSYGSSGESESDSEVFRAVTGSGAVGRRQEVAPERTVGFGRIVGKAPEPCMFATAEEGEGASGWARFGTPLEVGKADDDSDGFWNPYIPEKWVDDELTLKLKATLKMPDA